MGFPKVVLLRPVPSSLSSEGSLIILNYIGQPLPGGGPSCSWSRTELRQLNGLRGSEGPAGLAGWLLLACCPPVCIEMWPRLKALGSFCALAEQFPLKGP